MCHQTPKHYIEIWHERPFSLHQDIHNWVQSDPDATTQSAPESPIIGLIENSAAVCEEAGTSGTSKESNPVTTKLTLPAATGETATATGIDGSEAKG